VIVVPTSILAWKEGAGHPPGSAGRGFGLTTSIEVPEAGGQMADASRHASADDPDG